MEELETIHCLLECKMVQLALENSLATFQKSQTSSYRGTPTSALLDTHSSEMKT